MPKGKKGFQPGRTKTGGRLPGTKNKITPMIEELERLKCSPLAELVKYLKDDEVSKSTKIKILSELLKYLYPQQKSMDLNFDNELNVAQEVKIKQSDVKQAIQDIHSLIDNQ